ncbi:MAG: ATPase [Rhizobiaceae bacterium]|nr:ATPase [Rhizobiaceae bacterium]
MRDFLNDIHEHLSDPDPVRRAQIQMKNPLPKRFYKDVAVGQDAGRFTIELDGRTVKTPARRLLSLPTRPAAELVAAEWRDQAEVIDPARMPVTRLVNSALDGVSDECEAVIADIVNYAGTDLLCYRADAPQSLVEAQAAKWDPVIYWAADALGARFILAEGVIHQTQPAAAIDAFAAALAKYREPLAVAALHTITTLTGSALLALAVAEGRIDADEAWRAAHADEDWNIEHWGSDAEAEARRAARWKDMKAASDLFSAVTG